MAGVHECGRRTDRLSDMDQATAQQYLAEAQAAQQKLATGTMEVEIQTADGRRVVFAQSSMEQLDRYIAQLQNDAAPATQRRRPVGFSFGR